MEQQEKKSIITKAVKKANIATSVVGAVYLLLLLHDMYTLGISIETIYFIVGVIIIMGFAWLVSFLIVFVIFAIAKAVDD